MPNQYTGKKRRRGRTYYSPARKRHRKNRSYKSKNPPPSNERGTKVDTKKIYNHTYRQKKKQLVNINTDSSDNATDSDINQSTDHINTDVQSQPLQQASAIISLQSQQINTLQRQLHHTTQQLQKSEQEVVHFVEQIVDYEHKEEQSSTDDDIIMSSIENKHKCDRNDRYSVK